MNNTLTHHGIKGQHWGIRRWQNEDGSLTPEGYKHYYNKDEKWATKRREKLMKTAYDRSRSEMGRYAKELQNEINLYNPVRKDGKRTINAAFANAYNKKLAEVMTKNMSDIRTPNMDMAIKFIASRGQLNSVELAIADDGVDMSQFKNGVWSSGRIAYTKKYANRSGEN